MAAAAPQTPSSGPSKWNAREDGESAWDRDERLYKSKKPSVMQYLQHAVAKSGRKPLSIVREYLRLARGRGKLPFHEYVSYGVYDPSLSEEERLRFLSINLYGPIVRRCDDITWEATTEDKWLCTRILDLAGLPSPPILGLIDSTDRTFPGTRTIRSEGEFGELARAHCSDGTALFCKPNRGVAGFGSFVVDRAEAERLHLRGEGWMAYDACFRQFIGGKSYIVQPLLHNHQVLSQWTDHLATVRICLLRTDSGVKVPFAVLKLAVSGNVVDQYWRPGNIACDLDPATGEIRRARTKDAFGSTDHQAHPFTGVDLVGERVPLWAELIALAHECSSIFAPMPYHSLDIAVLNDGPSIIEVNTGGSWELLQYASGRGFLTDEVLDFLRAYGYKG